MTAINTIKYWKRLQKLTLTLVIGVFVFFAGADFADGQNTVSGTVTDAQTGEVLPGVNIVVEGTTIGTSTNLDGKYELEVPSLEGSIVFTFVGYQRLEENINGRTTINAELEADVRMLDDVVVVGYGSQERQQLTGSGSSVSTDEFVTGNIERPTDLIQGKIPGLVVSQSGGADPNASPEIRLRGVSTFGAQQSPLIVVDGIIGASLENIDPNDIATIDVLKDASASAIYGTRGAAGVIQVTTKKGTSGETNVTYNTTFTVTGVENRIDVLSGDEWRQLGEELGIDVVDYGHDTDWFEEITQTGFNNVHNLAISGGTSSTTYRVSGNYRARGGL
jgi:iron complex outermembrane receptor protein